jgi:hypothetical protein
MDSNGLKYDIIYLDSIVSPELTLHLLRERIGKRSPGLHKMYYLNIRKLENSQFYSHLKISWLTPFFGIKRSGEIINYDSIFYDKSTELRSTFISKIKSTR